MSIHYGDEILTTSDVAARYNVHTRTVIGWIESGLLQARKSGRDYIIFGQVLEGFTPPKQGRPPKLKLYHSERLGMVTIPED